MKEAGTGEPRGARSLHTDAWLAALRERFHDVASRRVPYEAVEDVVQEALRVVVEHLPAQEAEERLSIAWCFQTLRNVIGDHYRRVRRACGRWAHLSEGAEVTSGEPDPIEALASPGPATSAAFSTR